MTMVSTVFIWRNGQAIQRYWYVDGELCSTEIP